MKYQVLFTAGLVFCLLSCDATKKLARQFDPTGSWEYTVKNTPLGDVPGTLMLEEMNGVWKGVMESSEGSLDLKNVVWTGKNMTATFDYQGTPMNVNITVPAENNTTFAGSVKSSFGDFDMVGIKKP